MPRNREVKPGDLLTPRLSLWHRNHLHLDKPFLALRPFTTPEGRTLSYDAWVFINPDGEMKVYDSAVFKHMKGKKQ